MSQESLNLSKATFYTSKNHSTRVYYYTSGQNNKIDTTRKVVVLSDSDRRSVVSIIDLIDGRWKSKTYQYADYIMDNETKIPHLIEIYDSKLPYTLVRSHNSSFIESYDEVISNRMESLASKLNSSVSTTNNNNNDNNNNSNNDNNNKKSRSKVSKSQRKNEVNQEIKHTKEQRNQSKVSKLKQNNNDNDNTVKENVVDTRTMLNEINQMMEELIVKYSNIRNRGCR